LIVRRICSGAALGASVRARAASISASAGTSRSTNPQASAVSASIFWPAIRIIFARAGPTSAVSREGSEGCGRKPSFITG